MRKTRAGAFRLPEAIRLKTSTLTPMFVQYDPVQYCLVDQYDLGVNIAKFICDKFVGLIYEAYTHQNQRYYRQLRTDILNDQVN